MPDTCVRMCACEQAPTGYMPTLHTPTYHSLWHFISRHAYRICIILMGFCFCETLRCCQAVMHTKGNKLCFPRSAMLDIAARTRSIRSKGFILATVRSSSSSEPGGNCCLPMQAVPAGKAKLFCSSVLDKLSSFCDLVS